MQDAKQNTVLSQSKGSAEDGLPTGPALAGGMGC